MNFMSLKKASLWVALIVIGQLHATTTLGLVIENRANHSQSPLDQDVESALDQDSSELEVKDAMSLPENVMPNDQGSSDKDGRMDCFDWQGNTVADGDKYIPEGNDMCSRCTCDNHFPILCQSVACSPPLNCEKPELVPGVCCEYKCLNGRGTQEGNATDNGGEDEKADGESLTNLSLRLIASTVTSFLVLALLLFMVHRLRQRRLLLAMRRFEARARHSNNDDTDSEPYIPDAFMSLECPPYTDPPPPYSPPKPPQILPGEQPPPYEEINQNGDANGNVANENRNSNSSGRGDVSNGDNYGGGGRPQNGSNQGNPAVELRAAQQSHQTAEVQQASGAMPVFNSRHQRSSSENIRPPNTLTAYASTDVVEGLGVVLSPGGDLASYSPYGESWSSWRRERDAVGEAIHLQHADRNGSSVQHQERPQSLGHSGSSGRVHSMPTTTAFQRFSNIFKRDSTKAKHRRREGRPFSEYSAPPHYATVPRSEMQQSSDHTHRNPALGDTGRRRCTTRPPHRGFPDRMCMSYDSTQAAYTLGANSPSTSSSSSTSTEHQTPRQHCNPNACSQDSSSPSGAVSSSVSEVNTFQRKQFHDDLCRHLPPLQLSETSATPSHNPPIHPPEQYNSRHLGNSLPQKEATACKSLYQINTTRTEPLKNGDAPKQKTPPLSFRHSSFLTASPSHSHSPDLPQRSLASFIKSNPSATISDIREHIMEPQLDPQAPHSASSPVESREFSCSATSNDTNVLSDRSSSTLIPSITAAQQDIRNLHDMPSSSLLTCHPVTCSQQQHRATVLQAAPEHISPSPSPSPPYTSMSGAMRRSQSEVSQGSIFSVCSETGEKRLKMNEENTEEKILAADLQYPEHHSLPRSRNAASRSGVSRQSASLYSSADPSAGGCSVQDQRQLPESTVVSSKFVNMPIDSQATFSSQHHDSVIPAYDAVVSSLIAVGSEDSKAVVTNCNINTASPNKVSAVKGLVSADSESDNVMQPVNILPTPPFVTYQSGRLMDTAVELTHPSEVLSGEERNQPAKHEKSTETQKKTKKKRKKERSNSSPLFCNVSNVKNVPSPKHIRRIPQKHEPLPEKEVKMKAFKPGEKKHRGQTVASRQGVRYPDLYSGNKSGRPVPSDDLPIFYGNADVYRGMGFDSSGSGASAIPVCPLQQPVYQFYPDPLERQVPRDHIEGNHGAWNDLNQPPNCHKHQGREPPNPGLSYPGCGTALPNSGKLDVGANQTKKKQGHKKVLLLTEKAGHSSSPSRHRSRPKSLTAASEKMPEKLQTDGILGRPSVVTGDMGMSCKGARSGFGHDLNFDDQSGVGDLYDRDMDFTYKRLSFPHESVQNYPSRTAPHPESINMDIANSLVSKNGGPAGVGGHPGNKSGLSNDLSFVSRSTNGVSGRSKKRQSLPSIMVTSLAPTVQEKPQSDAVRVQSGGHMRGPRSDIRGEDRAMIHGECTEATSYV